MSSPIDRFALTDENSVGRTFTGSFLGRTRRGTDIYLTVDERVVLHGDGDRVVVTGDIDEITALVAPLSDDGDGELAGALVQAADMAGGVPLTASITPALMYVAHVSPERKCPRARPVLSAGLPQRVTGNGRAIAVSLSQRRSYGSQ